MKTIWSVFFLLFVTKDESNAQFDICWEEYECQNLTFINNGIECNGYKSCQKNSLIKNDDESHFDAAWSSYDTDKIITTFILCGGSHACENVNNITITPSDGNAECSGVNSCVNAYFHQIPDELICFAASSCKNATINNVRKVEFYGQYSGIGALVNADSSSWTATNVWIGSFGYYSGYNATAYCWSGQDCIIDCEGNGCLGLTVICENGNDHCTVICNETIGIICPSMNFSDRSALGYLTDEDIALKSISLYPTAEAQQMITSEYEMVCQSDPVSSEVNTRCMNDNICHRDTIDLIADDIEDSICCGGDSSCDSALLRVKSGFNVIIPSGEAGLEVNIIGEYKGSKSNTSVFCHSWDACFYGNFTNVSFVDCAGIWGCDKSYFFDVDTIVCSAFRSCREAVFYNPGTIYVTASWAAKDMKIYTERCDDCDKWNSNIMNLELLAWNGVLGLELYCEYGNQCNVLCGAYGGCFETTLYCTQSDDTKDFEGNSGNCNVTCDVDCPEIIIYQTVNSSTLNLATTTTTASLASNNTYSSTIDNTNNPQNDDTNSTLVQLENMYNYILASFVIILVALIVLGTIDGKLIRKNEQFKALAIFFTGIYVFDFVSGMGKTCI